MFSLQTLGLINSASFHHRRHGHTMHDIDYQVIRGLCGRGYWTPKPHKPWQGKAFQTYPPQTTVTKLLPYICESLSSHLRICAEGAIWQGKDLRWIPLTLQWLHNICERLLRYCFQLWGFPWCKVKVLNNHGMYFIYFQMHGATSVIFHYLIQLEMTLVSQRQDDMSKYASFHLAIN